MWMASWAASISLDPEGARLIDAAHEAIRDTDGFTEGIAPMASRKGQGG